MTWYGWGGADRSVTGYTDNYVYVDNIYMPLGRETANGQHPIVVVALEGWARGRYASRGGVMKLEWNGGGGLLGDTDWFTVGADSQAYPTGHIGGVDALIGNGGPVRFVIDLDGSFWYARGGGGGPSYDGDGLARDQTLAGGMDYVEAPSAPGYPNLSSSPNVQGRVDVYWGPPATDGGWGIYGYRIAYKRSIDQNWSEFDVGATSTVALTGLQPGYNYDVRLAAKNGVTDRAGTTSVWTGVNTIMVPGVPGPPTGLSATPSTNTLGQVALSWSAPSVAPGGITRYNIYGDGKLLGTSTVTNYTATGLTENATVSFTVRARNPFSDSNNTTGPDSNAVSARVPGRPGAPTGLSSVADAVTPGKISLSWSAPTEQGGGVVKYAIYRSTGDKMAETTSLSYVFTTLTPGETYTFYVVAYSAVSNTAGVAGPASNTTTATALGAPGVPTGLTFYYCIWAFAPQLGTCRQCN
jgi:hypothetical protein